MRSNLNMFGRLNRGELGMGRCTEKGLRPGPCAEEKETGVLYRGPPC